MKKTVEMMRHIYERIMAVIVAHINEEGMNEIMKNTRIPYSQLITLRKIGREGRVGQFVGTTTIGAIFILLWYFNIDIRNIIPSILDNESTFYKLNQYYMTNISQWLTALQHYRKSGDASELNRVLKEMSEALIHNPVNGGTDGPVQRLRDPGNRGALWEADQ